MVKKISKNLKDTEEIAKQILKMVYEKEKSAATIVGLYGNLGAGKTALSQAIGKLLNIKENITSPTFVIMKSYQLSGENFQKLIHIDAYRLEKEKELINLGWADIIADPKNLVLIEWPENVSKILPKEYLRINICHAGDSSREIEIKMI